MYENKETKVFSLAGTLNESFVYAFCGALTNDLTKEAQKMWFF